MLNILLLVVAAVVLAAMVVEEVAVVPADTDLQPYHCKQELIQSLLVAVVLGELAMLASCKGYPVGPGRVLGVAALPVHWYALICVLRGQKPRFAPTPKLPLVGGGLRLRLRLGRAPARQRADQR